MKKYILLTSLLVLPILLSGCLVTNLNLKTSAKKPAPQAVVETKITGSLLDILNQKLPMRCTVPQKNFTADADSIMYVNGKNLRNDATVTAKDGTKNVASMLIKDNTMYIWGSVLPGQGIKFPLDDFSKEENKGKLPDISQKNELNCLPWIVDTTVFELPSNVVFSDFTEITKGLSPELPPQESAPQTDNTAICKTCDAITEATGKAECLATFKCN